MAGLLGADPSLLLSASQQQVLPRGVGSSLQGKRGEYSLARGKRGVGSMSNARSDSTCCTPSMVGHQTAAIDGGPGRLRSNRSRSIESSSSSRSSGRSSTRSRRGRSGGGKSRVVNSALIASRASAGCMSEKEIVASAIAGVAMVRGAQHPVICGSHAANADISTASADVSAADVDIRIATAANTGALDLSDCNLTEIPSAVLSLTDLHDLSLAGNKISSLPAGIAKLTKLRRLGLAGNNLSQLPAEIGQLKSLEGLWLHGNQIQSIPEELGSLPRLRMLALAGNQLRSLPDSISSLSNLQVLSAAGNDISQLPQGIGNLRSLRIMAMFGNSLSSIPGSIAELSALEDLWLQGNCLIQLPASLAGLVSLRQLSLADNRLQQISAVGFAGLPSLESLWLYGNRLSHVPRLSSCRRLAKLWLEGNPNLVLDADGINSIADLSMLRTLGIDSHQAQNCNSSLLSLVVSKISVSRIAGTGRAAASGGYFKLQPWTSSSPSHPSRFGESGHEQASESGQSQQQQRRASTLVVAFGSAPAVPNWAGLLKNVQKEMEADKRCRPFDTLFVVDPTRSWYTHDPLDRSATSAVSLTMSAASLATPALPMVSSFGCTPSSSQQDLGTPNSTSFHPPAVPSAAAPPPAAEGGYYWTELSAAVTRYERVVMVGDSMGASAALLFSPLAHAVIAFCPQVDLSTASIRPGRDQPWLAEFRDQILAAVKRHGSEQSGRQHGMGGMPMSNAAPSEHTGSTPSVHVHCGNWSHDREQARLLEGLPQVHVKVHNVDSHRLAKDLDVHGMLVPLVRSVIEGSTA